MKEKIEMQEVKKFIDEVNRTKNYDRKRVADYHDRIFGQEKRPENNPPCPIMQMRQIKAWYQDQKKVD